MDGEVAGRVTRPGVRVARGFGAVALVLVALSGFFFLGAALLPPGSKLHSLFFQLWYLHDVGAERNIPAWYASVLWAVLAGGAFAAAAVATRRRVGWILVALVAVAASLDEHSELHERLDQIGNPIAAALGIDLWFTWVIPGALLALAVAATLWPLVAALPLASRRPILVGGAAYLLGATVVESVSGLVLAGFGGQVTWHFIAVTLLEELLELVGVVLAIAGVLRLFVVRRTPDGSFLVHFEESVDR